MREKEGMESRPKKTLGRKLVEIPSADDGSPMSAECSSISIRI